MQVLESSIEGSCRKWAEQQGGKLLKIQNARGWPDRLLLKPGGKAALIEFKAPGKKPKPLQAWRITRLLELGFVATYVDNLEDFKNVYERL